MVKYNFANKKSSIKKFIQMLNIHAIVVQFSHKCLPRGTGN